MNFSPAKHVRISWHGQALSLPPPSIRVAVLFYQHRGVYLHLHFPNPEISSYNGQGLSTRGTMLTFLRLFTIDNINIKSGIVFL